MLSLHYASSLAVALSLYDPFGQHFDPIEVILTTGRPSLASAIIAVGVQS